MTRMRRFEDIGKKRIAVWDTPVEGGKTFTFNLTECILSSVLVVFGTTTGVRMTQSSFLEQLVRNDMKH